MSERMEFEKWLMKEHLLDATWNDDRNCYDEYPAHLAYKSWSASRAVPDVQELVRYRMDVDIDILHPIVEPDGEYVRHDQAAAIIAAKDGRITAQAEEIARLENDLEAMQHRAEAAEAKLAQIEKSEPVAWMHPEAGWTDVSKAEVAVHCKDGAEPTPLYTAPVAKHADLKAERDRYKQALEFYANISPIAYDFGHTAKAALNPSEKQT